MPEQEVQAEKGRQPVLLTWVVRAEDRSLGRWLDRTSRGGAGSVSAKNRVVEKVIDSSNLTFRWPNLLVFRWHRAVEAMGDV